VLTAGHAGERSDWIGFHGPKYRTETPRRVLNSGRKGLKNA